MSGKQQKTYFTSSDKDDKSESNKGSIPICDWANEGRCCPGLVPIKCQYSGGCNGPEGCPNNLPQPAWCLAELFFQSDLS